MKILVFLAAAFALSLVLTGLLRRYALRVNMLDIPNERSSHTAPTPRGGGLAVVLIFMLAALVLVRQGSIPADLALLLLPACLLVAVIGWLDDHYSVPAGIRFSIHLLASVAGLYFLGSMPDLPLFHEHIMLGTWSYIFIAPALVWAINLHNFMDGIDGIASGEAIFVAAGAALILWLNGGYGPHATLLALLATVTGGFLAWNWPPAKIFMGDACSGFLGLSIGLMALATSTTAAINLWTWLILYGVFAVDATYTLARRVISGERFYEAHRSHAYQILARRWQSHLKVTLLYLAVNMCWLFPLAVVSSRYPEYGVVCSALALVPIILAVHIVGAGTRND